MSNCQMRINVCCVLSILLFIPTFSFANNESYNIDEVRENALEFINVLFGKRPPSLRDRIYYGGRESLENDETVLELIMCKKKYRISNPTNSKICWDYINDRALRADKAESLYYDLIRNTINTTPEMLKISSIERSTTINRHDEYTDYKITISIDNKSEQIVLSHPSRRDDASEEGLVSIIAIKTPIHNYLHLKR